MQKNNYFVVPPFLPLYSYIERVKLEIMDLRVILCQLPAREAKVQTCESTIHLMFDSIR